jgi:hypothetical protein
MRDTRLWLFVRLAIIIFGAMSGISFTSPETVMHSNVNWAACGIILLACPFAVLFVVGIQAINPMSAAVWRRPSWYINPFIFREPLQFLHLAAFDFIAGGIVALITLPFRGLAAAPLAVSLVAVGCGVWLGIQLCMVTFRNKMEEKANQSTDPTP